MPSCDAARRERFRCWTHRKQFEPFALPGSPYAWPRCERAKTIVYVCRTILPIDMSVFAGDFFAERCLCLILRARCDASGDIWADHFLNCRGAQQSQLFLYYRIRVIRLDEKFFLHTDGSSVHAFIYAHNSHASLAFAVQQRCV